MNKSTKGELLRVKDLLIKRIKAKLTNFKHLFNRKWGLSIDLIFIEKKKTISDLYLKYKPV